MRPLPPKLAFIVEQRGRWYVRDDRYLCESGKLNARYWHSYSTRSFPTRESAQAAADEINVARAGLLMEVRR